jgi:hypothetical protein
MEKADRFTEKCFCAASDLSWQSRSGGFQTAGLHLYTERSRSKMLALVDADGRTPGVTVLLHFPGNQAPLPVRSFSIGR